MFDVIIIGGGSNGTGLARDLAKRGAKVMLCEKGDFARGATGASSAMIHGGPRYLLNDTETTKHSCQDSGYIQKIAPHLVFRIPFLVPVQKSFPYGRMSLLVHDVYFDVYDRFTPLKNGIPHAKLSVAEMKKIEPGLAGDFWGGVTLDEWGIDPGRLCVLNAIDAARHGAEIRTYTEVVGITRDSANAVSGVRIRVRGEATVTDVPAKLVVNCGGPWAEKLAGLVPENTGVKLRPGKGVHLVYEKRLTNFAVITHAVDGREVFVMPYLNESWIGTTDDDFYGDLDDLSATQDEVAYLKQAAEHVLPAMKHQRLISTRVGVRNTMHGWGLHEDELSRGYKILDHKAQGVSGFYSLVGGKLASYRVQAEEAADAVCTILKIDTPCRTHLDALPGGEHTPDELDLTSKYPINRLTARRLIARHGALAGQVLEIGHETPTGYAIVDPNEPVLECELRYSIRNEMVNRLADMPMRVRLGMGADQGMRGGLRAAQIFAEERSLDPTSMREELMGFLRTRWRAARPVMTGQQLAQAELLMTQYTGLWQLPSLVPAA